MKRSKIQSIFEERLKSYNDKLQRLLNEARDENGAVTTEHLVNRTFIWDFGEITKYETLRKSYKQLLQTIKGIDWSTVREDELSLKEWLNSRRESYMQLAMMRDERSSSQSSNLVKSYQREAFKEVYSDLERILSYNTIEVD